MPIFLCVNSTEFFGAIQRVDTSLAVHLPAALTIHFFHTTDNKKSEPLKTRFMMKIHTTMKKFPTWKKLSIDIDGSTMMMDFLALDHYNNTSVYAIDVFNVAGDGKNMFIKNEIFPVCVCVSVKKLANT